MTKKEKILSAALDLFAKEGFMVTSTSKVAKKAGVSEGLIFRHFGNKNGLLKAIMEEGESRAKLLFADIVLETDPKEVLRKTLQMSLKTANSPTESDFWKLQYKIKWETEEYVPQKVEPLKIALNRAFEELGYKNPGQETEELVSLIDGMAMRHFLDDSFDLSKLVEHLTNKYNL